MQNWIGVKCPVCEKPFNEDDDVVVCPICGAPYHRSCYQEKGDCIFTELHEKGESWESPEIEIPVSVPTHEIKDQDCPRCGVLNAHSSLFCASCGSPLKITPATHANSQHVQSTGFPPMYGVGGVPLSFDPMGGVRPTDMLDENISYGEISKVVQQNTRYYLPMFSRIKNQKKSKFNFAAFLFSGGWFLHRKQYKLGVLFTIAMFAFYLGQIFTTYYVAVPKIVSLLHAAGETIPEFGITTQQIMRISGTIGGNDLFLISLPLILSALMLAVMLVAGFTGNRLYMKHCIRMVNISRKSTQNAEDYNTRIMERGGVNTTLSMCLLICYFLCTYLPIFFYNPPY